ncbi:MAG: hypothetical protein AAGA68_11040 [Pseudomonadota bacterium]
MTPYRVRSFRFDRLRYIGDLRLKCYRIGTSAAALKDAGAECYERALAYVGDQLPTILRVDAYPHHGLGYLIVHIGAQRVWLLLHWWHGEDIVLAHLASAPLGSGQFRSERGQPFHACVWEHVVIHHEREVWVRHMLTTQPDPTGYLEDQLADGDY